jgi:hypothetical protein
MRLNGREPLGKPLDKEQPFHQGNEDKFARLDQLAEQLDKPAGAKHVTNFFQICVANAQGLNPNALEMAARLGVPRVSCTLNLRNSLRRSQNSRILKRRSSCLHAARLLADANSSSPTGGFGIEITRNKYAAVNNRPSHQKETRIALYRSHRSLTETRRNALVLTKEVGAPFSTIISKRNQQVKAHSSSLLERRVLRVERLNKIGLKSNFAAE